MQEKLPEEQSKSSIVKFAKTFQIFDQVLKQEVISYQPPKLSNLPTFESTAKQMCWSVVLIKFIKNLEIEIQKLKYNVVVTGIKLQFEQGKSQLVAPGQSL